MQRRVLPVLRPPALSYRDFDDSPAERLCRWQCSDVPYGNADVMLRQLQVERLGPVKLKTEVTQRLPLAVPILVARVVLVRRVAESPSA